MKKVLFISLFALFSCLLIAQDVVFENETKDYSEVDENGPNLKKYNHGYFSYGFVLGENLTGANINYGSSGFTEFGFRYKLKFNQYLSAGYSFSARFQFNSIMQEVGKLIPDATLNRKENLNFNSLGGDLYLRINFSKRRGNMIGFYMDMGARADYIYKMLHQTKNTENGIKSKIKKHGYDFNIPYTYGPVFRLGKNQYALTATYRYSNYFKNTANLPELPRILLGIEFGIF